MWSYWISSVSNVKRISIDTPKHYLKCFLSRLANWAHRKHIKILGVTCLSGRFENKWEEADMHALLYASQINSEVIITELKLRLSKESTQVKQQHYNK